MLNSEDIVVWFFPFISMYNAIQMPAMKLAAPLAASEQEGTV
jgi:hypothetical protein